MQEPERNGTEPSGFSTAPKNAKKREYIYDFGKALKCDHPVMRILVRGSPFYVCDECKYTFLISSATLWPQHFWPIMGALAVNSFQLQYGAEALQKVLTTPVGQMDGSPQRPPLPPGVAYSDVAAFIESLDGHGDRKDAIDQFNKFLIASPEEQRRLIKEAKESLKQLKDPALGFLIEGPDETEDEEDA